MSVVDDVRETIRLVQASERLAALAEPIKAAISVTERVLEVAPELGPEMAAVKTRLLEIVGHVQAGNGVLSAKLDIVVERD